MLYKILHANAKLNQDERVMYVMLLDHYHYIRFPSATQISVQPEKRIIIDTKVNKFTTPYNFHVHT